MMKTKILVLSLAATGWMFAQGRPGFGPPGVGPAGPDTEARLTKMLNLSATQQNAVHTALQEHRVATQGLRDQMQTLMTQMHAAIKSSSTEQIDTLSASIATLHQQQIASQAKAAAKIYATLTADQKTQVGDNIGMLMGGGLGMGMGLGSRPAGAPRRGPPNN